MARKKLIFLILNALLTAGIFAEGFYPRGADAYAGQSSQPPNSKYFHSRSLSPAGLLILFYQKTLSPQDGPTCRFKPTCSRFSRIAISRHGFFKGVFLTADRLVRDNPFNPPGDDAVP